MARQSTVPKARGGKAPPGKNGELDLGGGGGSDTPAALHEEARRRYLNYALSRHHLARAARTCATVSSRCSAGSSTGCGTTTGSRPTRSTQKCAKVVGTIMGQLPPSRRHRDLRRSGPHGPGLLAALPAGRRARQLRLARRRCGRGDALHGVPPGSRWPRSCSPSWTRTTVPFRPNYDGTHSEPIVLPALRAAAADERHHRASRWAWPPTSRPTTSPSCATRWSPSSKDPKLETKDLLKFIKGPDFPTGGQILNSKKELREIYETGQGSVRVRGEWKLEELPRGGQQIIITSIPYAVNKSNLVAKIGDLVRERKLAPLIDVRDESTKDVRIVLEIKRDAGPELVMAYLYKHTPLQTNFNVNLTCLVPTREPGGRHAHSGWISRRSSSTSSTSASRWSPSASSSSSRSSRSACTSSRASRRSTTRSTR